MFTLLAIKFLIKLKCCQTLHSDSAAQCHKQLQGAGAGMVAKGWSERACNSMRSRRRSEYKSCVMRSMRWLCRRQFSSFSVSYAFIAGLIHSFIHIFIWWHSFRFIASFVPRSPTPASSPTCCMHNQKDAMHKAADSSAPGQGESSRVFWALVSCSPFILSPSFFSAAAPPPFCCKLNANKLSTAVK